MTVINTLMNRTHRAIEPTFWYHIITSRRLDQYIFFGLSKSYPSLIMIWSIAGATEARKQMVWDSQVQIKVIIEFWRKHKLYLVADKRDGNIFLG